MNMLKTRVGQRVTSQAHATVACKTLTGGSSLVCTHADRDSRISAGAPGNSDLDRGYEAILNCIFS